MPIPTWVPGEILASSDVNSWFVPLAAIRTTAQSVTSSTTLINDNTLFVPLAANASYFVVYYLDYEGAATGTGDIKWAFTVPSGGSMRHAPQYVGVSSLNQQGAGVFTTGTVACGSNGAGVSLAAIGCGTAVTTTTAGNLQIQWAQNTSSATATIMHIGSALYAYRIS